MTTHDHAMFLSSHVATREAREILKQLPAFRLLTAQDLEDRWTRVLANPKPGQVTTKMEQFVLGGKTPGVDATGADVQSTAAEA